jgi:hypothetical protein
MPTLVFVVSEQGQICKVIDQGKVPSIVGRDFLPSLADRLGLALKCFSESPTHPQAV